MKQKLTTGRSDSQDKARRMFKKLMKHSTMDKQRAKRFSRLSRDLSITFRTVCPNVKPKLIGTIIALLLDVVDRSDQIRRDVQELTRFKHPRDAQALKSSLQDLQFLSLAHQRRHIAQLLRYMPSLFRGIKTGEGSRSPRKGLIDQLTDILDS
jgi:hypothetical protein